MDRPKKVIDDTLPEEKLKTDEKDETRETENSSKNEKVLSDSPVTSPMKQKRKSELINESEIKRKRSEDYEQKVECEDKKLIFSSSVESAASEDSLLGKCEKSLSSTAEISGNIKVETEEQKNVKPSDKIVLKGENVEIPDETGSTAQAPVEASETVIFQSKCADNEPNLLDARLPRQSALQEIESTGHFGPSCAKRIKPTNLDSGTGPSSAVIQTSSMNLKNISDVDPENPQMKLGSTDDCKEKRNMVSIQTECKPSKLKSDSSFDQPKSCLSKNEKLPIGNIRVDSVHDREASSREIEKNYPVPLQMKENAEEMNKIEISNSSDSSESAEPELGPFGYFDEEDIQTQQAILESHSQQLHLEKNVKFESKTEDEKTVLPEDYYSSSGGDSSVSYDALLQMNMALKSLIGFMVYANGNLAETEGRHSQFMEYVRRYPNSEYYEMHYPMIKGILAAISAKKNENSEKEKPEKNDKAVNPGVLITKPRSPVIKLSTDNSQFPVKSPSTENPKSTPVSPTTENKSPVSPIPPPKKQEDNKSPKTDSDIKYKEYPGIAEEPTKVKKDARYQKKFYKQKPVTLPVNWSGDRANEPEVEGDHDEDPQIQRVGDNPPSSRDRDDESIIGEKKPSCEKDLPSISESDMQDTDVSKESSFKEETPNTDSGEESNELLPSALKKFPKSR